MTRGVIFDFNGTLFSDTDLQAEAWNRMFQKYHQRNIGPTEFEDHFHGRVNSVIRDYFFPPEMDETEKDRALLEKEALYRQVVLEEPKRIRFVTGVSDLLDRLKLQGIPFTIATASEITNVQFYFEVFPLNRWFSGPEALVYDDGTFPGKPAPDIYIKAAEKLGVPPADCLVVEDSRSGITAAKRAGIGRILAMNPELSREIIAADPAIETIISDFNLFFERYIQS